jgi:hypothetical protein
MLHIKGNITVFSQTFERKDLDMQRSVIRTYTCTVTGKKYKQAWQIYTGRYR